MDIFRGLMMCSDRTAVFNTVSEHFRSMGFRASCYIVPSGRDDGTLDLSDFGFPTEWMDRYLIDGLGAYDPVPTFAMRHGRVFWWNDIPQMKKLDRAEERFFNELINSTMTDGLALPTYGLNQRVGFFGAGMIESDKVKATADPALLLAVAQTAHSRLDQLSLESRQDIRVSPRERQILHWIAAGKSNHEIGVILGISSATVATYNKRLFDKLGVNDRVAASTKAIRLGLV